MIDFNKIEENELQDLKRIVSTVSDKSELERYFLFTKDPTEKAIIYIFCTRILINAENMLDDSDLKTAIKQFLNENYNIYIELLDLLERKNKYIFNRHKIEDKIFKLSNEKVVYEMIDLFSILTERINVIQTSKLKGVLLEGKSGTEFKKIFVEKKEF